MKTNCLNAGTDKGITMTTVTILLMLTLTVVGSLTILYYVNHFINEHDVNSCS